MAYAQWILFHIINSLRSGRISVQNAQVFWGKFYSRGNKDDEASSDTINLIRVSAGSMADIESCGRSDAASGTEGQFDLYEDENKTCTVYWSCPWGDKSNDFAVRDLNTSAGYKATGTSWNHGAGALGRVDVEISRRG